VLLLLLDAKEIVVGSLLVGLDVTVAVSADAAAAAASLLLLLGDVAVPLPTVVALELAGVEGTVGLVVAV
jgi:hypothetical protein